MNSASALEQASGRRFVPAAIVLGVGLAGFVDGIVFHQILQWHHMVSSTERWRTTTVAGLEANTLADGLFHAAALATVVAAIVLFRRGRPVAISTVSSRALIGSALIGAGAFNLVEGLVDHELLGIHHVRSGPHHKAYDLVFLAASAALAAAGWLIARRAGSGRLTAFS